MNDPDTTALWQVWREAAMRERVDAALRELYDRLDATVRARGPTCWMSGRCCNFDAYGHRLYVTGLEIAWLLNHRGAWDEAGQTMLDAGGCPFQINRLCTVHALRPLGCRVFFCQEGTEAWQQDVYEQFLNELRTLHETHDLPYRYMEWRDGLRSAAATLIRTSP